MLLKFNKENYFPSQWDFITKARKYPISGYIGGFGSGKTFILLRRCLLAMLTKLNKEGKSSGLVLYPTYDLANELFVEPFCDMLEKYHIPYEYKKAEHRFITAAGNIKIYQLQMPQRIVGSEYTWAAIDEMDIESFKNADMAFKKTLGRMRGCDDAELFIVSTPESFHYCHKIFVEDDANDRFMVNGKTTDNIYLPQKYIELLESNYDDKMLKAYRDGQFVNLVGGTYYAFDREKNVAKVDYNPNKPIYVGIDFNVSPLACCLFNRYAEKPQIRVFDSISLDHQGDGDLLTERMAITIKEKYPNNTYYCYPDATGRQRNSSSQYSDISILKKHFKVKVKHINPRVVNRVNAMNKALSGNMIIDTRCKDLINDLEKVTNKQGTREIDKSNKLLSHSSDALGYAVTYEFPVNKPQLWSIDR